DEPFEGFVVIEGDRIAQVGKGVPDDDLIRGHDEIIDCRDKTVMPGFCDNHVHVFLGALDMDTCNLNDTESEEEAAKKIFEHSKDMDYEWVIAFGWSHYGWDKKELPSKESLDKYFPDKPVIAVNDELHALWVNSKAMELCGVDRNTKDPEYSEFKRDSEGNPTGYILEQSAMRFFSDKAFDFSFDKDKYLVKKFAKRALQKGVTAVGDMEIIGIMKAEAYGELEDNDELELRIFFSPSIHKDTEELLKMKKRYHSDRLCFLGAKGFVDGTPLGHTGMLVDEYTDMPGYYGEPAVDLKWMKEKVEDLYKHDIPVRLHACGDGAVREALDYIESAQQKYGMKDLRSTIEHIENIHPDDLDRFKETDTIPSIQPYHMTMDSFEDHPIFEILGEERSKLSWPGKTLQKHGAKVAMGTDCPIVPLEPLSTLYYAVNRLMDDGCPEGGWNPQEKFTMAEAIKCSTIGTAYLMHKDHIIGTLEKGKKADVIILSGNVFEIDPKQIENLYVEKTVFDGRLYENEKVE
ncbi:MAG TPA: amidohydrolase, partial [Anaerovoracaceae bacterium]|nr:amidohydrolase [Anaerovoracaceae bacterium]